MYITIIYTSSYGAWLADPRNYYHVAHELNAHSDEPHRMPATYSELHRDIRGCFTAAEIEILSPGYMALRDGNRLTTSPVPRQATEMATASSRQAWSSPAVPDPSARTEEVVGMGGFRRARADHILPAVWSTVDTAQGRKLRSRRGPFSECPGRSGSSGGTVSGGSLAPHGRCGGPPQPSSWESTRARISSTIVWTSAMSSRNRGSP